MVEFAVDASFGHVGAEDGGQGKAVAGVYICAFTAFRMHAPIGQQFRAVDADACIGELRAVTFAHKSVSSECEISPRCLFRRIHHDQMRQP